MLFFDEQILKNQSELSSLFTKEIAYLENIKKANSKQKDFIVDFMQKFANSTTYIESSYASEIQDFLVELKNQLNMSNINLTTLESLSKDLTKISQNPNVSSFKNFNITYTDKILDIFSNMQKTEEFLQHNFEKFFDFKISIKKKDKDEDKELDINDIAPFYITELSEYQINESKSNSVINLKPENKNESKAETETEANIESVIQSNKEICVNNPMETAVENNIDNVVEPVVESDFPPENTLLISERNKIIYLPYSNESIEKKLNQYPQYTKSEIITKYYSQPLKLYRTPSIARFKEAFSLMREKEKASIIDAFDLGMELFFNYNLHPAIISACNTLDELDVYLDYLENGETQKFTCFNIVFDVAPTIVKNKKDF